MALRHYALIFLAGTTVSWWPQCQTLPPSHEFGAPTGIALGMGFPGGTDSDLYAYVTVPNQLGIRGIDLYAQGIVQNKIAVGRRLGSIVAHTGVSATVDKLWAVDKAGGALVSIDPAASYNPTASTVTFVDAGAPSNVAMSPPQVSSGFTGTSTWTVTYHENLGLWEVVSSTSGAQKTYASTGYAYTTDWDEVTFTINQTGPNPPTEGDQFVFSTDNGVKVATLMSAGVATLLPFDSTLALASFFSPPQLAVFDLATGIPQKVFSLSPGAIPSRMEMSPDGTAVYLSDLGNPVLYRLNTAGVVPGWTLQTLSVPVPMRDVAVTGDATRVMAMPANADDVFVWTHPGFVPVNFNGTVPGFNPVPFPGPIRTLSGARMPHVTHGTGTPTYPVLVTTHAGNVFFLAGSTGCIDFANSGGATLTSVSFRDAGAPSAPQFNPLGFRASPCGGRVLTETWSIVYDALRGGWTLTGSISGLQSRLLYDNIPFITDRGDLTFEIDGALPGSGAEDDGDTFYVSVQSGLAPVALGNLPDRPVFFTQSVNGVPVEYALIPDVAGDDVQQVDVGNQVVVVTYR